MDMKSIEKTANLIQNNQMSLMVFQMEHIFKQAPTFYGINVSKVREVIEGKRFPVSKTPNSHELIEGMIQLRGTFLPVIDMPRWLGQPMTAEEKDRSVIIVCDFSKNILGFRVAHIFGVEEKSWNELHPTQNLGASGESRVVNQTTVKYEKQDELCYVLDIEKLLAECMPEMAEKLKPVISQSEINTINSDNWKTFFDKKTLICADDSPSIRLYLGTLFTQLNIQYKIFENGKLLIDYLDTLPDSKSISAIITDIEMPEASGHTVIKYIRNNNKFKNLKVAVHSSMTSENNERDVTKLGADFFIGKIDTNEIIEILKKMSNISG
jgi:two-component system chemotaxis response regulator CheV